MLSTILENMIRGASAKDITDLFLWLLLIIFVLSLWWVRSEKHGSFTNYTPTLLTSIGILGTFAGIITGLMDFRTDDIDGSIGFLLEGLKTAFVTSLSGMFLSIVYKALVTSGLLVKRGSDSVVEGDLGIDDLYQVMTRQVEGIEQIKKAISENDESSLVGQMKLVRSDLNDNHKTVNQHLMHMAQAITNVRQVAISQAEEFSQFQDRLWIKLQDFADMMSKSATEQVIEALKSVIEDFNKNLVEQFGDNFKQLNEAVFRLLEWQENYKGQLADMKNQYDLGVQAIQKTEESVSNISTEAKVIPATMLELKQVVEVNQHQINELERHLTAFKDIRDRAVMAVPEIREQIDQAIEGAKAANEKLATGMKESADRMSEILIEGSTEFKNNVSQANAALIEASQTTANSSEEIKNQFSAALEDINNNIRNLLAELQQGGEQINRSFEQAGKEILEETNQIGTRLEQTILEQATEHRKQADKIFAGLDLSIQNALSSTGESVEKQMTMIDKALGEELEKVMNSMGSALTSITGGFTSDYRKLVDEMKKITSAHRQN
jgi:hypothetical protein